MASPGQRKAPCGCSQQGAKSEIAGDEPRASLRLMASRPGEVNFPLKEGCGDVARFHGWINGVSFPFIACSLV